MVKVLHDDFMLCGRARREAENVRSCVPGKVVSWRLSLGTISQPYRASSAS